MVVVRRSLVVLEDVLQVVGDGVTNDSGPPLCVVDLRSRLTEVAPHLSCEADLMALDVPFSHTGYHPSPCTAQLSAVHQYGPLRPRAAARLLPRRSPLSVCCLPVLCIPATTARRGPPGSSARALHRCT